MPYYALFHSYFRQQKTPRRTPRSQDVSFVCITSFSWFYNVLCINDLLDLFSVTFVVAISYFAIVSGVTLMTERENMSFEIKQDRSRGKAEDPTLTTPGINLSAISPITRFPRFVVNFSLPIYAKLPRFSPNCIQLQAVSASSLDLFNC